jgi:ribosomal protein S1
MKITGKVVQIAPFGVFVDTGKNHHALLEIINMDDPSVFPKVGETIEATIIDHRNGYDRLSTKESFNARTS